ncbi:MAG TPA: RNA polymerase sigma factor SigJ [Vicinamibacteria bacterium]|nr:RNA polymerase sigma factor SigJ [Vicinamibacteria bacterium]
MGEHTVLAERFEENRSRLRAVAYRMLGSLNEADDAVQEAWLRLSRTQAGDIQNLNAWLTTVVGRVCLDLLRLRKSRREEPMEVYLPEPIVSPLEGVDPENQALLADSVGLALFVVLESLSPAERVAFVLHDMFDVPFDDIASIVGRTPTAARKLASRARGRVQQAPVPDSDLDRHREIVDAFLAASRDGDLEAIVAVLDPEVVLRVDAARGASKVVRGASEVARQALSFSQFAPFLRRLLVNGAMGVVAAPQGKVFSLTGFTVRDGKIVAMDILADPERLRRIDFSALGD